MEVNVMIKESVKDLLRQEAIKLMKRPDAVVQIDELLEGVFEFIEETNSKCFDRLLEEKIINESDRKERQSNLREHITPLIQTTKENMKLNYVLWAKEQELKNQINKVRESEQRIDHAQEMVNKYKEEAERIETYTLNDITKNLEIARDRLNMIGNTAAELLNINVTDEGEGKKKAIAQNNIISQVETIMNEMERLKIWPEGAEKPSYQKDEKSKNTKLTGRKKKNVEEEKSEDDCVKEEAAVSTPEEGIKAGEVTEGADNSDVTEALVATDEDKEKNAETENMESEMSKAPVELAAEQLKIES
jgi:hypothetical protein